MTGTRPDLDSLHLRRASRALVVDPDDRILLVRFEFDTTVWATPGGGIEPHESPVDALRRELREEVGLHEPEIGPVIWDMTRILIGRMGPWDGQHDLIHLVRAPRFEPQPAMSWEQLNAENLWELRWWSLDEIEPATSDTVRFVPGPLAALTRDLLRDGPPAEPVRIVHGR